MQSVLEFLLQVIIVPSILLLIFYVSVQLAVFSKTSSQQDQISRALGLLLGFTLFVLFVVLNLFTGLLPTTALKQYADAVNYPVAFGVTGLIIGLALMALIELLLVARAIAILIVVLSSASLTAFYLYIFIAESRSLLLISTVCFLGGVLFYGVIRPDIFKEIRPRTTLRMIFAFWARR